MKGYIDTVLELYISSNKYVLMNFTFKLLELNVIPKPL